MTTILKQTIKHAKTLDFKIVEEQGNNTREEFFFLIAILVKENLMIINAELNET